MLPYLFQISLFKTKMKKIISYINLYSRLHLTFFSFNLTFIPFTFYISAARLYLPQVRIRRVTGRWASAPGFGGWGRSVHWMATWGLLPQAPIGRPLPSTAAEFLWGTSFLGDTKMVWLGKTWLSFLGGSPSKVLLPLFLWPQTTSC